MRLKQYVKTAVIAISILFLIATGNAIADDIIRIASPYKVQNLDPVRSAAAGTIELYGQLYSRVLRLDNDGKLAPGLASSWNVSDGGKTITLRLRNAKFSDGSPITADDVVFSPHCAFATTKNPLIRRPCSSSKQLPPREPTRWFSS